MSESLSLLSDVGGGGGGGGGESGGVIDVVVPAEFWSTKLVLLSVIVSLTCSHLMSTSTVDGPLQLCVHRLACSISSRVVLGWEGTPSCVGKSKWILRREGAA